MVTELCQNEELRRVKDELISFFGQVSAAERADTNAGDSSVSLVLYGWQQTITGYANERIDASANYSRKVS